MGRLLLLGPFSSLTAPEDIIDIHTYTQTLVNTNVTMRNKFVNRFYVDFNPLQHI